jgi:nitrous oxidase accessory protein NosD
MHGPTFFIVWTNLSNLTPFSLQVLSRANHSSCVRLHNANATTIRGLAFVGCSFGVHLTQNAAHRAGLAVDQ